MADEKKKVTVVTVNLALLEHLVNTARDASAMLDTAGIFRIAARDLDKAAVNMIIEAHRRETEKRLV